MLAKIPIIKESILNVINEIIETIKRTTHKHFVPFKKNKEKAKINANAIQITTTRSTRIGIVCIVCKDIFGLSFNSDTNRCLFTSK